MEATPWQIEQLMILKDDCGEDLEHEEKLNFVNTILCDNLSLLDKSAALLDQPQSSIRHIVCDNRSFYCIRGSRNQTYLCFLEASSNYCSCQSYFNQAKKSPDKIMV